VIAIVNIGPAGDGLTNYEVRINRDVVTTFTHVRSEGLAKCLLLASHAVEEQRVNDMAKFIRRLGPNPREAS
jgi:hypothetical protein